MFHLFRSSKVCKNCDNWYETENIQEDRLDKLLKASRELLKDAKNNNFMVTDDSVFGLEKAVHEFDKN